jgi:hypothetical protein
VGVIEFVDQGTDVPSKVLLSLRAGVEDALHRGFSDSAKFRFGSGGTEYPLEKVKVPVKRVLQRCLGCSPHEKRARLVLLHVVLDGAEKADNDNE